MKALSGIMAVVTGLILLAVGGCASSRVDWNGRIGTYTYDDAVRELGPPDKAAQLTDHSTVADWITSRGSRSSMGYVGGWHPYGPYGWGGPGFVVMDPGSPDRILRLTFDPNGRLASWQRVYR